MEYFSLKNYLDNTEIFSGLYPSFVSCLEDAVIQKIDLSSVDLRHKNLANANLDGAIMPNANFAGANLTGVNLSEANLRSSIFFNTALYNCCLAFSILNGSDFRLAQFGGTLINGSTLQNSIFSSLSCFELDFSSTRNMEGCHYVSEDGKMHRMSARPLVLKGFFNSQIIVMDHSIKIGTKLFPRALMPGLLKVMSKEVHNRSKAPSGRLIRNTS